MATKNKIRTMYLGYMRPPSVVLNHALSSQYFSQSGISLSAIHFAIAIDSANIAMPATRIIKSASNSVFESFFMSLLRIHLRTALGTVFLRGFLPASFGMDDIAAM